MHLRDAAADAEETSTVIVDSVGNVLSDGDAVFKPEVGTGPEDHNIECKIDGFGQMILKPAVVKKIV
nr:PhnA domain-containing protein [Corynebacterium rouxii]